MTSLAAPPSLDPSVTPIFAELHQAKAQQEEELARLGEALARRGREHAAAAAELKHAEEAKAGALATRGLAATMMSRSRCMPMPPTHAPTERAHASGSTAPPI